jgi:hypothetical protein
MDERKASMGKVMVGSTPQTGFGGRQLRLKTTTTGTTAISSTGLTESCTTLNVPDAQPS